MRSPRFSIVIPTRQRADKLQFSLQTCLRQRFDDYEIVVCDNCSSRETREVVEQANSNKVRYVRAPQPLAMSDNWELAVSHAQGDYILLIGDDDGLLPHALPEIDTLIRDTEAKALRWNCVFYLWPDVNLEGQGNFLRIPLGRQLRLVQSRSAIEKVISFQADYVSLPMLYNAVIHRSLFEEARRRCGRLFGSHCPDIYSGFLFAYLSGEYWSLEAPMSVAGLSGHSNGVATLHAQGANRVADDFHEMNKQAGLQLHESLPRIPQSLSVCVADSFLHVTEMLGLDDESSSLDRRLLIRRCLQTLAVETDDQWRQALQLMRESLEDSVELVEWFDTDCQGIARLNRKRASLRTEELGFDGTDLCLSADEFGAENVAAVAELTGKILNFDTRQTACQADESFHMLDQQLREKEQVIQDLILRNETLRQQLAAHDSPWRGGTAGGVLRGVAKRAMKTFGLRRAG